MLGLSYGPTPWITAEQMQLARELTERTNESPKENRGTARGSLVRRLGEALYRGFVRAGKAHAIARGLMLY